jgi:hypothetical protein
MAGGLNTAGRTRSDDGLIAVEADFHHVAALVKGGKHGFTSDFFARSADMHTGIAMKGAVHVFCIGPWYGFTAILANDDFLAPAFQTSAVIWLSAADAEGRMTNLDFVGWSSALQHR